MPTVSPRVVVADDSALMRRIVSNSLTRAGVDVVGAAADGDQALALCERERPDAMTLDLAMPGLDGLGVLRRLKAGGTRLPVVVVSAFSPSQGARAVDALAEGAFDLVPKPAVGESLDAFTESLVTKVRLAADASSVRPTNGAHVARPPSGPADWTRTHGRHRHLHWRPPGARRSAPQASRSPRRGHLDRAAHAAGVHRLTCRAP